MNLFIADLKSMLDAHNGADYTVSEVSESEEEMAALPAIILNPLKRTRTHRSATHDDALAAEVMVAVVRDKASGYAASDRAVEQLADQVEASLIAHFELHAAVVHGRSYSLDDTITTDYGQGARASTRLSVARLTLAATRCLPA